MLKKSVFEYENYKAYLTDSIAQKPSAGRGEKSRMAKALQCHLAYVSQVLNGAAHFSLEQGEVLNRYLGHHEAESDFFLLLILYGRAGSANLEAYYAKKVRETRERSLSLKNRLDFKKALTLEDQAHYYSAWYFAAVHLLIAIPEFQTRQALQRRLRISAKQLSKVLAFLVSVGLASEEKGRYLPGLTSLHLGDDSPMISRHHANWKMLALRSIEEEAPGDLHYSSAITIARSDAARIRAVLVQAIEQVRPIVKASKEDDLYCYALDFFRVPGIEVAS
ncbi:MAG: hypothetical protein A2X94_00275 [Bdellovibrionales bacterium GWB1_55_8]|nr:MAG: hypothetical protein A2X94_00275 [Bdellovibrionales bacterium GWB1_55_8]